MTSLVKNNNIKFFTASICSVKYDGKDVSLSTVDKCKIAMAFFFGTLLFGIGILVGFKVSYDLRKRKIEALNNRELALSKIQEKADAAIKAYQKSFPVGAQQKQFPTKSLMPLLPTERAALQRRQHLLK